MTILYRSKVFEDIVNSTLADFEEEDFISENLSYDDFVFSYSKFFSLPEESKTAFINKYYKLPFIQHSIRKARKKANSLSQEEVKQLKKLKDLTLIQESHHTAYPLSWKILTKVEVPDFKGDYRDIIKYSVPSLSDEELTGKEIIDIILYGDIKIDKPFSLVKDLIEYLKEDSPYAISRLEQVFNDCVDIFYYKKEKRLVEDRSYLLKEDAEKEAAQYGENSIPYSMTEKDPNVVLLHKLLQNVNLNTFNLKDVYILHVRDESHSEDFHYIFESAEEAWDFAVKEVEEMYLKGNSLKSSCPDHYREGESFTLELNYGPITYEVVSPLI